mmetsp:Transcript_15089/g.46781  ORF Transcript_15089/g.46781 Transcript_15089/m.46781 type:complete len:205 (-) Transcript_15089:829-1443(-)
MNWHSVITSKCGYGPCSRSLPLRCGIAEPALGGYSFSDAKMPCSGMPPSFTMLPMTPSAVPPDDSMSSTKMQRSPRRTPLSTMEPSPLKPTLACVVAPMPSPSGYQLASTKGSFVRRATAWAMGAPPRSASATMTSQRLKAPKWTMRSAMASTMSGVIIGAKSVSWKKEYGYPPSFSFGVIGMPTKALVMCAVRRCTSASFICR